MFGGVHNEFLGIFTKLQKVTISYATSVHPYAWNNSAPTGWSFMKFDILSIFQKSVEIIQI
jgi:hypothetical protein